jgi:hypothetical protein
MINVAAGLRGASGIRSLGLPRLAKTVLEISSTSSCESESLFLHTLPQ